MQLECVNAVTGEKPVPTVKWSSSETVRWSGVRESEKWERHCSVLGWGRLLMGCASMSQPVCKPQTHTRTHLLGPNKFGGLHNSFHPIHTQAQMELIETPECSQRHRPPVFSNQENKPISSHCLKAAVWVWSLSGGHMLGTSAECHSC